MIRLKSWQWLILATPIVSIILFFGIAAGAQINRWGVTWIWGVIVLVLVGWRWLLVKWTKLIFNDVDNIMSSSQQELKNSTSQAIVTDNNGQVTAKVEEILQTIIDTTREDVPLWEDLSLFFQRCQELVQGIAKI